MHSRTDNPGKPIGGHRTSHRSPTGGHCGGHDTFFGGQGWTTGGGKFHVLYKILQKSVFTRPLGSKIDFKLDC